MNILNDIKNIGLWLIRMFRSRLTLYLVVYKNSMKVKNLENGMVASGNSELAYSSSRLLIADPIVAESFAKVLLKQVYSSIEQSTRTVRIVCHPFDKNLSELSPAEKMIFTDFVNNIGGHEIIIANSDKEMTDEELVIKNYT